MRKSFRRRKLLLACSALAVLLLTGCATTPDRPGQPDDLCAIFRERPDWYVAASNARERWNISIPLIMAVLYQESLFGAEAKPPRTRCLWVFPGPRPSSAYGYAQASDAAWEDYQRWTGRRGAQRDDFADAVDFVGWYCHMSHIRCGIAKADGYNLYLAYHEGHGGYNRRSYANKPWLQGVARKVERRTSVYAGQLATCEPSLRTGEPCCLWPF